MKLFPNIFTRPTNKETVQMLLTKSNPSAADETASLAPYGTSDARKKLRWLISTPPENGAIRLEISPAMAAAMMERNADNDWHNRPHSEKAVDRYVTGIQRGWKYTGEPLIFSGSGRLLNGQHRLMACMKANTSFPCLVVFGIEEDAFMFMDVGTKRQAGHIFSIENVMNANWAAATARLLYSYSNRPSWDGRALDIENDLLLDFYSRHEDIQRSHTIARQLYNEGLLPMMRWGGFLHYICAQKHRAEADEFFGTLATGIGIKNTNDTMYLLRRRLSKAAKEKNPLEKGAPAYLGAYIIKTWNCIRRNETKSVLKWRGEQNPNEPFPRAI